LSTPQHRSPSSRASPPLSRVAAALAGARRPVVGAATLAETLVVLTARQGPFARTVFDCLSSEINLGVADFIADHTGVAQRAHLRFGRGRHPADLNIGDCLSFAVARLAHDPLLAIGKDFPQTDLEFGDGIVGYWPSPRA